MKLVQLEQDAGSGPAWINVDSVILTTYGAATAKQPRSLILEFSGRSSLTLTNAGDITAVASALSITVPSPPAPVAKPADSTVAPSEKAAPPFSALPPEDAAIAERLVEDITRRVNERRVLSGDQT
jgi:hypothetical protein